MSTLLTKLKQLLAPAKQQFKNKPFAKTLLLNATYEVIGFIPEDRVISHLWKDKVDVISEWDFEINWKNNTKIKWPATIRMKYRVPSVNHLVSFSRSALYIRDNFVCQYCIKKFVKTKLTIDHVIPKSKGGKTCWENCTTSCEDCNYKKKNRTPEEANMAIFNKPTRPTRALLWSGYANMHEDWKFQLGLI